MRSTTPEISTLALVLLAAILPAAPQAMAEDLFDRLAEHPRVEHLTSADGLPHNVVFTLARDATGFLWMGTQGGPSRYDGVEFVPWRHHPDDPTSLALDDVSLIVPDGDQGLWLATWGSGLERFDLESETFEHFPPQAGDPSRLQDGRVQSLLLEPDAVWAGTFGGGLSRLDRARATFTTLRHDPSDATSLPHDRVWSLARDHQGILWIGTQNGLCRLRADQRCDRFVAGGGEGEDHGLGRSEIRALQVDQRGVLWIGTNGGVYRRWPGEDRFEPFEGAGVELADDIVNVLFEDSRGDFWIGTNGRGLVRCQGEPEVCQRLVHRPGDSTSLGYNDVRALLEDGAGTLWIATRGGGVDRIALRPSAFHSLRSEPGSRPRLPSGYVWSFAEDLEGRLWVGTGRGLLRAEAEDFIYFGSSEDGAEDLSAESRTDVLPDGHVSDLLFDSRGQLWVGTYDGGLARRLDDGGNFRIYRNDPADPTSLASNHVHRVYEASDGSLWIGTRQGLDRYRPESDDFEHFHSHADRPGQVSDDLVRELLEDPEGFLWVGTDDDGLYRFDPSSGDFEHVTTTPGTVGERIHSLYRDAGGGLWVGTDLGLARRHPDGSFETRDDRHGLPSPHVLSIQGDGLGHLWLGTDRGLARYDPVSETVRTYRINDGLQGHELLPRAAFADRRGRLFFGGIEGLTVFDPRQVADPRNTAPVVLTGFYRFNRPADLGRPPSRLSEITLEPSDDFISFTFAHLDYTVPSTHRHRYRLEGFDRSWIEAGPRRRADYTNLDPGDYVFQVRAANSHGVWSDHTLSLRLHITPPFWRTWWFQLLSGAALLGLVWGVHRSRIAVLQEQERELQQRVEAALAELSASEQRYQLLFERNLAGVVRGDGDGRVLDCNAAFAHIFGFDSTDSCRSELVLDLTPAAPLRQALDERSPVAGFEQTTTRRDGSQVALLWNASLVPTRTGPPTFEATVIDITELRRTEDTLLRAKKLESLGLMAGGVAHDFNNLLMVISGSSEMLRSQLPAHISVEVLSYLRMIDQATRRASKLSLQMLAYVGQGGHSQELVSLSTLIEELAPGLEAIVAPGHLELRLEPDLPPILADLTQLRQAVTQLVTNAAEASDGSNPPPVQLATYALERRAEDFGQALFDRPPASGAYVVLSVRDQGVGMDEPTRARIFDPFFTTKFTGRGLGLAVVWGIARAHRGALEVDSEPGSGSEIRLYLPVGKRQR